MKRKRSSESSSSEHEERRRKRHRHKHKHRHRHKRRHSRKEREKVVDESSSSSFEFDESIVTKHTIYDITWKMLEKNIYKFKFPVTLEHGQETVFMCAKAVEDYCDKFKVNYEVSDTNPPEYTFFVKSNEGYKDVVKPNITEYTTPELADLLVSKYLKECFQNDTFFEFPMDRAIVQPETVEAGVKAVKKYCTERGIECEVDKGTEPISFHFKISDGVKKKILQESIIEKQKEEERKLKKKEKQKKEKKRLKRLAKLAQDYEPLV
eukprot:TRINITY_DN2066_c0_g1_i2.p1 TRINITY_DN2066_c0_g1~~TRINITY_DN2066_c0_g1_i2.p1  ORF type:complete len:265 (-),score=67.04 TRINITY_DN2066_c0_g1_i2:1188-1982(-)